MIKGKTGRLLQVGSYSAEPASPVLNCLEEVDSSARPAPIRIEHLFDALSRNEFVLHFQPKVSLSSGAIVGMEALIRWRHPTLGLVYPDRFIPLAENSPCIVDIGNWVVEECCRTLRSWKLRGLPLTSLAINISSRHFCEETLPDFIRNTLDEYETEPRLIEIEITESAMMLDYTLASDNVRRLKDIGVHLSLDDFGTGYSSLTYLSRFPIDLVKIDKSFVRDITSNATDATIVQAIIAMSHKLGKAVLAEGVENEEQMLYLQKCECDQIQGYYFSRPQPEADVALLLKEDRRMAFPHSTPQIGGKVLIVDDDVLVLRSLKRALHREGYELLTATGAEDGFSLLARHAVQVVISDQQMPVMTGTEFLARVKALHPQTIRMVLTANSEITTATEAINRGAIYRFMIKPWNDEALKSEIASAMRHWRELYGSSLAQ